MDDHIEIHKIVAQIFASIPEIQLVGQGANCLEAIDLCEQLSPDVVLMDIFLKVRLLRI